MTWLSVLSSLLVAPSVLAVSARVVLLDGTRIDGEASIDTKLGLVVTNSDNLSTNFGFSHIQSIRFNASTNISEMPSNLVFPRGWTNLDIGSVTRPGNARWEDEQLTIRAAGTRFWLPQPDEFHFLYRVFNGNGQVIAQVSKSDAAIAGIMFRESLGADSEFVAQAATLGSDGVIFRTRRDRRYRDLIHAEGDWSNRDDLRPPCWLKLVRRDKRFAAYQSTDEGITWQAIYETPNDWGRTIYAGLFVLSGNANELRTASFSNVLVEDEMDNRKLATNKTHQAALLLTDGSMLRTDHISADATKVRFQAGASNFTISALSISRIFYGAVPDRLNRELATRRRGVLLKSGDFFEGDLDSINKSQIKLSSVLFGSRTFPADRVLAVAISEPRPLSTPFRIRTVDGSLIQATGLTPAENSVSVDEPRLGTWTIGLMDLVEISREKKVK